jgi:hypothetical protein
VIKTPVAEVLRSLKLRLDDHWQQVLKYNASNHTGTSRDAEPTPVAP